MSDVQSSNNLIAWTIGVCALIIILPFWLLFIIVMAVLHNKGKLDMKLPNFANPFAGTSSTDNSAFEAYRAETLAQLEADHKAFGEHLADLKKKKDRAEFDRFMNGRLG